VAAAPLIRPPQLHSGLAAEIQARHANSKPALTERELQIVKHLASGESAAEIANDLDLAASTVKTHLARIYDKLGVSERAAAVAKAMRLGIID
jgi:two-component system nitrate/nitrite response regulator NarL